ncbi:hypothetical protein AX774_g1743 [Zancudomyces culisetae]|uniref:Uncharacterized protein n=1 Tax=Zancudomyces culisetae TaxID=1213189 RepID=A0A1R1PN69_ZANCU|nr:hypothetical protein AX774_g4133 [Zancudomyces culisetae]OMH84735.1 hypothetical protein AX774_g1743 [Zancudomyces culisetae]|eukprot:OMH82381.1 hypothetical protein AX774_g4133 [Zancudomyces culisetae]
MDALGFLREYEETELDENPEYGIEFGRAEELAVGDKDGLSIHKPFVRIASRNSSFASKAYDLETEDNLDEIVNKMWENESEVSENELPSFLKNRKSDLDDRQGESTSAGFGSEYGDRWGFIGSNDLFKNGDDLPQFNTRYVIEKDSINTAFSPENQYGYRKYISQDGGEDGYEGSSSHYRAYEKPTGPSSPAEETGGKHVIYKAKIVTKREHSGSGRVSLIKNMGNINEPRIVGKMIYDPVRKMWVGNEAEENVFDATFEQEMERFYKKGSEWDDDIRGSIEVVTTSDDNGNGTGITGEVCKDRQTSNGEYELNTKKSRNRLENRKTLTQSSEKIYFDSIQQKWVKVNQEETDDSNSTRGTLDYRLRGLRSKHSKHRLSYEPDETAVDEQSYSKPYDFAIYSPRNTEENEDPFSNIPIFNEPSSLTEKEISSTFNPDQSDVEGWLGFSSSYQQFTQSWFPPN